MVSACNSSCSPVTVTEDNIHWSKEHWNNFFLKQLRGQDSDRRSFDVVVSDIHPLNPLNSIVKYADDTYLIVSASERSSERAELDHISACAVSNNLQLNVTKSREMIIRRRLGIEQPPLISGINRVQSMTLFVVLLRDDLNASQWRS